MLPAIVKILGVEDAGAGASCPHCGATGRWIYSFICEDNTTRHAMAGCLKAFPQMSEIARQAAYAKLRATGGKTMGEKLTAQQEASRAAMIRFETKEEAVKMTKAALDTFCLWMIEEQDKIEVEGGDYKSFRLENRATYQALRAAFEAAQAL